MITTTLFFMMAVLSAILGYKARGFLTEEQNKKVDSLLRKLFRIPEDPKDDL